MSNITTQILRVDINTDKLLPVAFTHQNDTARTIVFEMYNAGVPYDMTNKTVKFAYKTPIVDGSYAVVTGDSMVNGTVDGNTVTATFTTAYTSVCGVGMLTMIITPTSGTIRPVNIKLVVQRSADGPDTIAGASDFPRTLSDMVDSWMDANIDLSAFYSVMQDWLDEHPDAVEGLVLGYVMPQMFGAKGDGVTDDSQAIQDAFDSGLNVYFPKATYYITEAIFVNGLSGRTIDFGTSTFHFKSNAGEVRYGFWFEECENLVLKDAYMYSDEDQTPIKPSGSSAERTYASNVDAICLMSCKNVTARNFSFENFNSDFWLKSDRGGNKIGNRDILIDGWVSNGTTMPMYAERSRNMVIRNVDLNPPNDLDHMYHMVYLYGETDNVLIDGGVMRASDNDFGPFIDGTGKVSAAEYVTNVVLSNLHMVYGKTLCYQIQNSDMTFNNCRIEALNANALRLANGNGVFTFKNCDIEVTQGCIEVTDGATGKAVFDSCTVKYTGSNYTTLLHGQELYASNCLLKNVGLAYQPSSYTSGKIVCRDSRIELDSNYHGSYVIYSNATNIDCHIDNLTAMSDGRVVNKFFDTAANRDTTGVIMHSVSLFNFNKFCDITENGMYLMCFLNGMLFKPKYEDINRIPISIGTDGQVYDSDGYIDGYRLHSTGGLGEQSGTITTGFMRFLLGDIYKVWNGHWDSVAATNKYLTFCIYDKDFNYLGSYNNNNLKSGDVLQDDSSVTVENDVITFNIACTNRNAYYCRLSVFWTSSDGTPIAKRYISE